MSKILGSKNRTDYDTPWKLIIEKYFQPLLEFLFPHIARDIDWSKPSEHLDKEMLKIQKGAKIEKKIADKLIKIYKKSGEETWVNLHLEIQGGSEKNFAERLFQYYYRIYDRYQIPLATLVILADSNKKWRPSNYCREVWGCQMDLKFPVVKLLDYLGKGEILEKSRNPIAKVVQAHLAALSTRGKPNLKLQHKLRLVKNLYLLGYNGEDIRAIYEFIDYELSLPSNLESDFINEMQRYEREINMSYITSAERIGRERGKQEGRQEGKQEGRQEAIHFLLALSKLYPSGIPQSVIDRVEKATSDELGQCIEKILDEKMA